MRLLLWVVGLSVWAVALPFGFKSEKQLLIALPDFDGSLSPCGCTKPMRGGIRRLATKVKSFGKWNPVVVSGGGWIEHPGRQDELKAETAAQLLKQLDVHAVNFRTELAKLGAPQCAALDRLTGGGKFISASVPNWGGLNLAPWNEEGPFLISGIVSDPGALSSLTGDPPVETDAAVSQFILEAKARGKLGVLLYSGGRDAARELAAKHPQLRLVIYSSSGTASSLEKIGETSLFTPGGHGTAMVTVAWNGSAWIDFQVHNLEPTIKDDEEASRLFKQYQSRVAGEKLIETVPRARSESFSGSKLCGTCHPKELEVWQKTKHASALKTLETERHDRDPDCVGCHVVGLDRVGGFRSREATPELADVGCESCHGPGDKHSRSPMIYRLKTAGKPSCLPCHKINHSPNFDFEKYWKQIEH